MARGTVNKVIILGRLGQDPDMRATASGNQVANLSMATNEIGPLDPQTQQRMEHTEWHRVVLFGRMAENAGTYLRKGSQVYLEGRLQTRKWKDQQGIERYSTEIVANEMQFIGGRTGEGNQSQHQGQAGQHNQARNQHQAGQHNQAAPNQPHSGFGPQGHANGQGYPQNGVQNHTGAVQPGGNPKGAGAFDEFVDDIPF